MRVLHVLDHSLPLHSGYSFRTAAILGAQRALGLETFHVTSAKHEAPFVPEEEAGGLRFHRTPPARGPLARLPVLDQVLVVRGLRRRLEEVVKEVAPDLLHVHSPCLNGLAALPVARRHGLPLLYEMRASWEDAAVSHGTCREGDLRYRVSRALETRVLFRADAVATICEGLREEIAARGIDPARITVVPNAVDPREFVPAAPSERLRGELGLTGARVLGFLGSFYRYEGLHLLLEALPHIAARAPDVRVLLVGGGFEEANLRRQAEALGGRVVFTGRVDHARVAEYYALCDAVVYPRLDVRLTRLVTPLKPLEAMALETLVVASDIGGHRELVRDGETGVLFRAGDARALADAVAGLLESPGRWTALREAGRRFVETERTWERSVARYLPVYERLAGEGAAVAAGA